METAAAPDTIATWSWPLQRIDNTKRTHCRYLVGILPLQPTPKGVRLELRLILQQWDHTAAAPYSWCFDFMKYGVSPDGRSTGPFREPGTHKVHKTQFAEVDWPAFFAAWGETGHWILQEFRRLQDSAPPAQIMFDKETSADEMSLGGAALGDADRVGGAAD